LRCGTAGAVRYELLMGDLLSAAGHFEKSRNVVSELTGLLKVAGFRSTIKSL
jgi:hypothetical protein